jgi:hypothetical protein
VGKSETPSEAAKEADMRKRIMAASSAGIACLVLSIGAGTAYAQTQPADVSNVNNANRGASEPGPHCHYVLPASGHNFELIISGAAHQGHTETGLPTGIFQATACV